VAGKEVVPALGLESFSCPHVNCRAIAHQTWFRPYIARFADGDKPWLPIDARARGDQFKTQGIDAEVLEFFDRLSEGEVFIETCAD
jgi:hypothetical protein